MNSYPTVKTRDGIVPLSGFKMSGEQAIAAMRKQLGKSSLAATYDKLTDQQRAIVLYAARIKPSTAIDTPLLQLPIAQREAVRMAIISLTDLGQLMAGVPVGREQIITEHPKRTSKRIAASTPANTTPAVDISQLAAELATEVKQRKRA